MGTFIISSAILAGIATLLGTILAIAYKYLQVEEDPRKDLVVDLLPGSNCGACGQPGCQAFADKLLLNEIAPGKCSVSSSAKIEEIADLLGVEATQEIKKVARLKCAGGEGSALKLASYKGEQSCRAAIQVNKGGRACEWGCLGFGDCEVACTFQAISMTEEFLPKVSIDKCTACNDCVEVCPLDLFVLQSVEEKLFVQCNSPITGEKATAACRVACDGCSRCVSDSEPGVLEMENGLPRIRFPEKTGIEASFRCPTGAIQWLEGNQFEFAWHSVNREGNYG